MWILVCRLALVPCLALLCAGQDTGLQIKDKQQEVAAFLKTAKTEREMRVALGDFNRLADRAFQINEYDLAGKLYGEAGKVAQALKDTSVAQTLAESAKRASDVGRQFKKAEQGFHRIEESKGTPEDYRDVGRFLCFVKGDWDFGLKYLAQGKDENLKKVAEEDLSGGPTSEATLALAEKWADIARKEPGAQDRALHWYGKAWDGLQGVSREKLRRRLQDMLRRKPSAKMPDMVRGWTDFGLFVRPDDTYLRSGKQAVKLGPIVDRPDIGSKQVSSNRFKVTPGQKLKLSGWVLTDGSEGVDQLRFVASDAAGAYAGQKDIGIPNDAPFWRRLEGEVVVPERAAMGHVAVFARSRAGNIWVDDFSLKDENGQELLGNGGFEP
jgi:hypothetical protein